MLSSFPMKRIAILISTLTLSGIVYAASLPAFRITRIKQPGPSSVSIVAEFDSHNQVSFPNHQLPTTWFEYGVDPSNLEQKTIETPRVGGHYIVEQRLFDLQPNTKYYVRPAVKLGGNTSYGKLSSFRITVEEKDVSYPVLGMYDDSRIEFTDEGYVRKNQKGSEMYTFSDFWKDLTRIFGTSEKGERDEKGEDTPTKERELVAEDITGGSVEQRSQHLGVSYDTQYRKYYRSSTYHPRMRSGFSRPTSLLPVLFLLLLLFVIVVLFHLFRLRKRRHYVPYPRIIRKTHAQHNPHRKIQRNPVGRRVVTHNNRYHIDHEPIEKARKGAE